jgi:mxaJ protein
LNAGLCDLVVGVPSDFELALTTSPYYSSSYVFVSRKDRHLNIHSLDDPRLRRLLIGVQLIGDDSTNSPPALILANRGITQNVRGYTVYGDYSRPDPPARIIDAVSAGSVDLAVAWGPLAGYFANRQKVPLELVEATPPPDLAFLRLAYAISMGVRKKDVVFRNQLEEILSRNKGRIEQILDEYGVPHLESADLRSAKE